MFVLWSDVCLLVENNKQSRKSIIFYSLVFGSGYVLYIHCEGFLLAIRVILKNGSEFSTTSLSFQYGQKKKVAVIASQLAYYRELMGIVDITQHASKTSSIGRTKLYIQRSRREVSGHVYIPGVCGFGFFSSNRVRCLQNPSGRVSGRTLTQRPGRVRVNLTRTQCFSGRVRVPLVHTGFDVYSRLLERKRQQYILSQTSCAKLYQYKVAG